MIMANKSNFPKRGEQVSLASLSPAISSRLAERDDNLPVWVRCPQRGQEHYSGLSRAKLYQLAVAGKIRSVSLREPGQVKGTRVFHLRSIFDYFESLESATTANAPTQEAA